MRNCLVVKSGSERIAVFFDQLVYVEADQRYLRFTTTKGSFLVDGSLKTMENKLPGHLFCRIHKSHIISLRHMEQFNGVRAIVQSKELPIGRQYRRAFHKIVSGNKV